MSDEQGRQAVLGIDTAGPVVGASLHGDGGTHGFSQRITRGADTVLTFGAVQSNHARQTAAAACKARSIGKKERLSSAPRSGSGRVTIPLRGWRSKPTATAPTPWTCLPASTISAWKPLRRAAALP